MIRLFFALLSFALLSCGAKGTKETGNMPEIKKQPIASAVPDFNADSAYAYVANQVAFGPRVPNTAAHKACGDYLASELKRFGAKVYQQEAILTAYDGTKLEARNIIGSFDPENSKRVLLFAHWDSRPYSDHDPDPSKHRTPLDGADDGGSGVGALLEIARDLGYGKYFINAAGGAITDDHQYVISGRNIPSIDIINYDPESKTGFASYWHTQKDNMENIDRETLKAAGQTVLEVIYNR